LQLFALSFVALFLELMLIRWVPAVVRFVAYYANLLLISSFLGLGIGVLLARRRWKFLSLFPLVLAANVGVLLACSYVPLPGTKYESRFYILHTAWISYPILVAIFLFNAAVFVPLGQRIGELFRALPPLRAYMWDLSGSLCGTIAFGVFSLMYFSPLIGLACVMLLFLFVASRRGRVIGLVCFPPTFVALLLSTDPSGIWSPYHYITIARLAPGWPAVREPPPNLRTMLDPPVYFVRVGRDFYQGHATLDLRRYPPGYNLTWMAGVFDRYLLPYQIAKNNDRVAVLGAGGGVDVQAALMAGAKHVDAVEIDPTLVQISRKFNSSGVYDHPGVSVHVDDARAFLRSTPTKFDVIAFGYLDSQSLFSSMSNVRIDGFIYTVESMRMAWSRLADDGMLAISFHAGPDWLRRRLQQMVREATGVDPLIYSQDDNLVIIAPKGAHRPALDEVGSMKKIQLDATPVDLPTDDWPYLYLSKRTIPPDYLAVIVTLLLLSIMAVRFAHGAAISASDAHFFFLGLGFLLLQTKSITDCSLYFGTTWLVTTIVIAGVLLMVLLANLVAMRLRSASRWWYAPLVTSLILLLVVPRDAVLAQPYALRLSWSLLVVPLPIFFAGLVFSNTFRDSRDTAASLGAKLIGATVGGFAEYLGMALGSQSLAFIVIAAYIASWLCRTMRRPAAQPASELTAELR
jgi:hypothetical protein